MAATTVSKPESSADSRGANEVDRATKREGNESELVGVQGTPTIQRGANEVDRATKREGNESELVAFPR